jgi:hypothetical protein
MRPRVAYLPALQGHLCLISNLKHINFICYMRPCVAYLPALQGPLYYATLLKECAYGLLLNAFNVSGALR